MILLVSTVKNVKCIEVYISVSLSPFAEVYARNRCTVDDGVPEIDIEVL
jgi:hypothetical protein